MMINLHFLCQAHSSLSIRLLLIWSAKRLQCNQQIPFHRMHCQQDNPIHATSPLQMVHNIICHLCFKQNQNWSQTRKLWLLITISVSSMFEYKVNYVLATLNTLQYSYSINKPVSFVLLLQILMKWNGLAGFIQKWICEVTNKSSSCASWLSS